MYEDKEINTLPSIQRALIGIPFLDGGRNPQEGFDCWGLVVFYYQLHGIVLPNYQIGAFCSGDIHQKIAQESCEKWVSVRKHELIALDLLAFRLDNDLPNFVTHVGVYSGEGKFTHCLQKTGVVVSRLRDPYWTTRLAGCYRRIKDPS